MGRISEGSIYPAAYMGSEGLKRKRLRQSEERTGKCQDGVELGEHGEDHGAGEDVVSVGHLVPDFDNASPYSSVS